VAVRGLSDRVPRGRQVKRLTAPAAALFLIGGGAIEERLVSGRRGIAGHAATPRLSGTRSRLGYFPRKNPLGGKRSVEGSIRAVERGGRLVEHKHGGFERESAGEHHALLFSDGELLR